jgi:hypothetical protein
MFDGKLGQKIYIFEGKHRRNKMKLQNGAVYYLDLGRMSFQQAFYRPVFPPLEGDGVISTPTFFLLDSSLFILIGVVLNSSVLSLRLSGESVVLRLS